MPGQNSHGSMNRNRSSFRSTETLKCSEVHPEVEEDWLQPNTPGSPNGHSVSFRLSNRSAAGAPGTSSTAKSSGILYDLHSILAHLTA